MEIHKGYEMSYEVYNCRETVKYDKWIREVVCEEECDRCDEECNNNGECNKNEEWMYVSKNTTNINNTNTNINNTNTNTTNTNNTNTQDDKIINILSYIRNKIGILSSKYQDHIQIFLEYLIYNDTNFNIQDKRIELSDKINKEILKYYNQDVNELEEIIKEIILEEHLLSQKNKFKEFRNMILEE